MKKNTFMHMSLALLATFALAGCNLFDSSSDNTIVEADLTYVTVEINPGVALMVDEDKQIAFAHALNGDGEMVMLQLQLEGKNLDDAVDDIVDETVALDFVSEETVDLDVEIDAMGNVEALKEQICTQTHTRLENTFEGHMLTVQTRTRTYTQTELDEAAAKGVTPLKLRLAKQAMLGNDDLLEEEALEMDTKALLNKTRHGATNMKKIASTLGEAFLEERKLIQEEYNADIQALKQAIMDGVANSEDVTSLEEDLVTLRQEMVTAIQALVANYRQQSTQAREQWQTEANHRRGGSQTSNTSHTSGQKNSLA